MTRLEHRYKKTGNPLYLFEAYNAGMKRSGLPPWWTVDVMAEHFAHFLGTADLGVEYSLPEIMAVTFPVTPAHWEQFNADRRAWRRQ